MSKLEIPNNYFTNSFSEEVWKTTYRSSSENSVKDTWKRVASAIAKVESKDKQKEYTEKFYDLLENFKFIPGGRILANAGLGNTNTSLINCFVSPKPKRNLDSIEGILEILRYQALTLKSEGGFGINFSFIRPRGGYIHGINGRTPGPIKFMELFDKSSEIITEGPGNYIPMQNEPIHPNEKKKIRKGAQMFILSDWCPDIQEFITAKQISNRLTKANLSVAISSEFMEKLNKVEELKKSGATAEEIAEIDAWDLIFPDTTYKAYNEEWDGNINLWKSKGYPIKVYNTVKVSELWDLIMKSTYLHNEPGVIFFDKANRDFCGNYLKDMHIDTCNPCVVEGTLVNTPYGYKKVETLKVGDLISTLHPNGYEPINDIEVNKDCDLFEIKFSDGGTQKVTAAHQYFVQRQGSRSKFVEKIRVDSLKPGDYVMVEPIKLLDTSFNQLDFDKGLIMGILLGDGCYSNLDKYAIKIASNQDDVEYNNEVKSLFNKYGYTFRKDDPSKKSKSLSLFLTTESSNKLTLDFNLSKSLSVNKYIPEDYINNYSKALGILNGLLATDGNINLSSNHPQFRITTSSENMALSLRRLCLNLGMHAQISVDNTLNRGGCINGREIKANYPKYTINIASSHLKTACSICYNNINPAKRKRIREVLYTSKLTGSSNCARILSITPCGKGTVYDLHCLESDSWITEGYVQRGCGEQMLSKSGCCNLGSLNLTQFVELKSGVPEFNFDKFKKYIPLAVRFLDNVIDIANLPLEEYKSLESYRRIGLGFMGLGSALLMLEIPYASDKAKEFIHKIGNYLNYYAIKESINLAKEKGSYKDCDIQKHFCNIKNTFKRTLSNDQIEELYTLAKDVNGIRHTALFSIQPTGNTSCLANNCSGGLEPIFMLSYVRTASVSILPEELKDKCPAYWNGDFSENSYFKKVIIPNTNIEYLEYISPSSNITYKIFKDRGLCKDVLIEDYGLYWRKSNHLPINDRLILQDTAMNLSVDQHLDILEACADCLDSSASKTINVSKDYSYIKFKDIYMNAFYSRSIKGVTTYREGTMAGVLNSNTTSSTIKDNKIKKYNAVKRPKVLPCDVYVLSSKGVKYYAIVSKLDEDPYEVFVGLQDKTGISQDLKETTLTKISRGKYLLETKDKSFSYIILNNGQNENCPSEVEAIARLTSTCLRHGVDVSFVVHQLEKSMGDITTFTKIMARILKKYIKEDIQVYGETCPICGSKLIRSEGCKLCKNCSWTACG